MSLPNYLANIKSSGIYRFVWDKSQVPAQTAETLRLVVGYSEKGPFNTPVYIESVSDFISIYGNVSKRLERRGIFFHRLAIQALSSGPILAMNVKPFSEETVDGVSFNPATLREFGIEENMIRSTSVENIYDTNRFWTLDSNKLPNDGKYISIYSTDVKESSCTIFIRPVRPSSYNMTLREWFNGVSDEPAPYLDKLMHLNLNHFFAEVYVFRGNFDKLISEKQILSKYFVNGGLNTEYKNVYGESVDVLEALANDPNSNFIGSYRGCTIPYFKDANGNYISLDVVFNSGYNSHKMLMNLNEDVLDVDSDDADISLELTLELNGEKVTTQAENVAFNGLIFGEIDKLYTNKDGESVPFDFSNGSIPNLPLTPIYLSGYDYKTISKSEKDLALQQKIFDFLKSEKGIRTALTNRVDVEYHYIVDTFQSYLGGADYKAVLSSIAKEKDNAFAILNFPPMSSFVEDAKYTSAVTGKFDINNVPKNYTLVSEVNGASYCAYYTQVIISDGTLKSVIPSAALVSNNFMEKWSSRQPYYIVAGPTYGRISWEGLVGPDYNFGRSDLDVLEPMGVNAIVYVPRKGTYINSNQTAKQLPISALSKVHVRELVIFLQNEIQSMLENYHWELNTQTLRDTVKAKADAILETVKNNGGVYEYLNVCDDSNNSSEVIDNEMLILSTHIEPARGAGKMIHELTLYRTGEMSSLIK